MRRDPVFTLLVLCVLLMAYVTVYPFHFSNFPTHYLTLDYPRGRAMWLDAWLNLLFFVPFGFLFGLRFPGWRGVAACAMASFVFSAGIEWIQTYVPSRFSSMCDLLTNSLGGAVGALLAQRKRIKTAQLADWLKDEVPGDRVGILICLWIIVKWSPFLPLLKIYSFLNHLKSALVWDLSIPKMLELAVGGVAVVFLLAENLHLRQAKRASWMLIGLLPLELVLWDRSKSVAEVAVCGLAMALAIWWLDRAKPSTGKWLAIAALLLIVMRELSPFRWGAEEVGRFLWMPFQGTMESSRIHALPVLAEKCFFYWYFLHQAQRSFGCALTKLALSLGIFVGLAEMGQRYQTGRTPEITDPLLCLLGALILHWSAKADQGLKRAVR